MALDILYLLLIPALYIYSTGFFLLKLLTGNNPKPYFGIFIPVLGTAFCTGLQLIMLKLNLIFIAKPVYSIAGFLAFGYLALSNKKDLTLKIKNLSQFTLPLSVLLISSFIFLTQRLTIGWGVVPLKTLSDSGFGMDDTAWHAAIAGMFKNNLPIPHPTLCGEILPKSHFMIHCLAAFYSILLERNSLDIFFFSLPLVIILFLVWQTYIFFSFVLRQSKTISIAGTLSACLGLNGAFLFFPVFGQKIVNLIPEPLPWIFWRLPGFGLSLFFSLPLIVILSRRISHDLKTSAKAFILFAVLACGLYAKPAIPISILAAYCLFCLYKKACGEKADLYILSTSIIFSFVFYCFFLSGNDYGFDGKNPFLPFVTLFSVFEKVAASFKQESLVQFKTIIFICGYLIFPIMAFLNAFKRTKKMSNEQLLLLLSSCIGFLYFFFLYSPMGAEYQFGVLAIFLANILFFSQINSKTNKILVTSLLILSGSFYIYHFYINCIPTDVYSEKKEVNKDIVEAMNWLNKNSNKNEGFFVNDQHYRSKMTNNAVYSALSERQSYISCFRYTPLTYINLYRGSSSPWSYRLTNNHQIYEGKCDLMLEISKQLNIRRLVLNKNIHDVSKVQACKALTKKFENNQITIYEINF